jgi:hypothetical protein
MRCASCGSDNPADTKFCIECGIPLKYCCRHCGAKDLPQAKFCGDCGMPLLVTITSVPKKVGRTFLQLLKGVPTIGETISKVLLPLVLAGLVLLVLSTIFDWPWRSGSKSITIASFTDTSGDKSGGFGRAIADALEFEILRIAQLHTLKNPWGRSQEIPSLELTGQQTVEHGEGTISVAGIELPLDAIVQALKPWFARPRTQYVVTGSLQRFPSGDDTRVEEAGDTAEKDACLKFPSGKGTRVQIIIRLEEDGRMLKRWSCLSRLTGYEESNAEIRPDVIHYMRQIAYEIMWVTLEGIEASSIKNFKSFIEGVHSFRLYKDTKDIIYFNEAHKHIWDAILLNKKYARAYFYLGNLYSWRASFEDFDSESREDFEHAARNAYIRVAMGATIKLYEANALSEFGIGLVNYRQYNNAKRKKKFLYAKLDDANKAFTAAWEQAPEFYFARTGRALIYKEKVILLKDSQDREGRKHCLNYAFREFQGAKNAATALKDLDSVKWIDKQILELDLEKQTVHNPKSIWSRVLASYRAIDPLVGALEGGSKCPDSNSLQALHPTR